MSKYVQEPPEIAELAGSQSAFAADVRHGLSLPRKRLSCKYFYDERGAALFQRICEQKEYYLTRLEMQIMRRHVSEMAEVIEPHALVIELGSGSAVKTRMLLDHLPEATGYIPVDVSHAQLREVAEAMAAAYPHLEVRPVCADFTSRFRLPDLERPARRRVVYFPGSTIGNLELADAAQFLRQIHQTVGPGGGLLIGVDLKKDPAVLHAAYNDAAKTTAQFNLNLLYRINRELDGNFVPSLFAHYAFYNPEYGRMEMHLVSSRRQLVSAAGLRFKFKPGESILTEYSYKHDPYEFAQLAASAGFELHHQWADDRRWFSVQFYFAC